VKREQLEEIKGYKQKRTENIWMGILRKINEGKKQFLVKL
jgi:hypothetical protein